MKPKYSCPSCHQEFSRRWNRERHIKTVHSRGATVLSDIQFYDYPTTRDVKESQSILDMPAALETGKTKDIFDEFIKLARFEQEMNELSGVNSLQRGTLARLNNAQTALHQIHSNFVLIPKFSVCGISGFVCPECVKFEAIYIKDLGYDRTMQHTHKCTPSDLETVLKDPDYKTILPAVELEANENLFVMTKSWLLGASFLNSYEILASTNISHEVHVLDTAFDDWLWQYTREKRRQIDDNDLKKFLAMAKATYAILNFSDKSSFFMFVSR